VGELLKGIPPRAMGQNKIWGGDSTKFNGEGGRLLKKQHGTLKWGITNKPFLKRTGDPLSGKKDKGSIRGGGLYKNKLSKRKTNTPKHKPGVVPGKKFMKKAQGTPETK